MLFLVILLLGYSVYSMAAERPKHDRVVVCYWGSWSVYRNDSGKFEIGNLDPSLCTHIIYSFAGLDEEADSIKALDPWQDLTENYGKGGYQRITSLKDRYPHLKVNIAIGGWNEGSAKYSKLAASEIRRKRFVASAVDFIKKYGFDGLDLDWEFPGKRGGTPDDKLNFLLLVKELRAAFRKYNFLLTAALGAGKDTIDGGYDVEGLSIYLDFIHMMCYDYHGTWDKKTGANAPLRSRDVFSVEYTINYMLKLGAPASKLVMGIPLYGRTFILERPVSSPTRPLQLGAAAKDVGFSGIFTGEKGFMGYNEICLELKENAASWTKYWDEESLTPFATNGTHLIVYDDERSIDKKIYFAMEKGLAGVMVWSIDTDDFHGTCSSDETFVNYPLMRSINKSIFNALRDLANDVDVQRKPSAADNLAVKSKLVMLTLLALINGFM